MSSTRSGKGVYQEIISKSDEPSAKQTNQNAELSGTFRGEMTPGNPCLYRGNPLERIRDGVIAPFREALPMKKLKCCVIAVLQSSDDICWCPGISDCLDSVVHLFDD